MVGLPSSGKTTRAREIQKYFAQQQCKEVVLISDNEIISQMDVDKNVLFLGKYVLKHYEAQVLFDVNVLCVKVIVDV